MRKFINKVYLCKDGRSYVCASAIIHANIEYALPKSQARQHWAEAVSNTTTTLRYQHHVLNYMDNFGCV